MLPQPGDRVRLTEDEAPCLEGDEGRVVEILSNGKLVVVCDKDKDCNSKGPFRCTVENWESPQC